MLSWWEILIVVGAVLFVIAVIAVSIIRKKKGKSSCCSDCTSCPFHSGCCNKDSKPTEKQ